MVIVHPYTASWIFYHHYCAINTKIKQESPVWTQEGYRPQHSKCLLCWSVFWWGGGRWRERGSHPVFDGAYPIPSWMGGTLSSPEWGDTSSSLGWGIPNPLSMGGIPIQSLMGVPPSWSWMGYFNPDLGWGYPPSTGWGTSLSRPGMECPPVPGMGYPPPDLGWGTPCRWMGYHPAPPRRGVNWHTNWKYYLLPTEHRSLLGAIEQSDLAGSCLTLCVNGSDNYETHKVRKKYLHIFLSQTHWQENEEKTVDLNNIDIFDVWRLVLTVCVLLFSLRTDPQYNFQRSFCTSNLFR